MKSVVFDEFGSPGKVLRVEVGEGALSDLADAARRAAGVDDVGFGHWNLLGRSSLDDLDARLARGP